MGKLDLYHNYTNCDRLSSHMKRQKSSRSKSDEDSLFYLAENITSRHIWSYVLGNAKNPVEFSVHFSYSNALHPR